MPFVQAKCPNCGGFLAVDNTKDAAVCQFCNTPFIVEKAINNYNITINGTVNVEQAKISVEGAPSIENLLLRAKGFVADREYNRAVEYYNKVLDLDPMNAEAKSGIHSITIPTSDNLIIERKKSFFSGPIKLRVLIDFEEIGYLKSGETKSFLIPLGKHTLTFKESSWNKATSAPSNRRDFSLPSALQYVKLEIKEAMNDIRTTVNILDC